jgi:CHAT domain-containing protein
LHIASHGFFLRDQQLTEETARWLKDGSMPMSLGENPLLRSGIALAGANERRSGDADDGILTALEVAQLDLDGTELVVLSACDTAVGEVQNGEGVYGLRRALALAGAQTQITSLWKVSDAATRTLMVDYYRRLLKGEGRSAALRQAQRSMLADSALAHPYYWASLVPIGNWSPLPALLEQRNRHSIGRRPATSIARE